MGAPVLRRGPAADPDPDGSLAAQHLASGKHARRWQVVVVLHALAAAQGQTWDFWELWSGCGNFTAAAQQRGLLVGPSVDIAANPKVPRLILDWEDPEDVAFMWWLLRELRPKHVHVGPPCTIWGPLGRLTAVRSIETWQRLRQQALRHLALAVRTMRWQHVHALTGPFEQPRACVLWKLPCVVALLELPGWNRHVWPRCAYGHRDPGSNLLYFKRQAFATTPLHIISNRRRS